MRKSFIIMAALVASVAAKAQTSFGLHANGIMASQTITASGLNINSDSRFSWKVGAIANIPLSTQFAFMPQLNFLNKGAEFNINGMKLESSLNYLELPLNFVYTSNGFFAGLGPVLSYGLSGTESGNGESIEVSFDGDADAQDDRSHYKALEIGGNILAGYKLKNGVFFNVHYNFGLNNITPVADAEQKSKYFGFGVGYFFPGR